MVDGMKLSHCVLSKPHRMHSKDAACYPIASARSVVCVSVRVGHTGKPC